MCFAQFRSAMIGLTLSLFAVSASYAGVRVSSPEQKRGPEIGARVRSLAASNKHLREALKRFEARGLDPRIDAAVMLSGKAVRNSSTRSMMVATDSVKSDEEVVSGDGVELIFIPAYTAPGYWEGTVDARRYDSYGTLTDEYIANVVMYSPDPESAYDVTSEDVVYEGVINDPEPRYPEQQYAYSEPDRPSAGNNGGRFRAFVEGGGMKQRSDLRWMGRWGDWGKCSLAWCVGAAAGCGAANWWNAEIAWGPCTAVGCIGSAIGCTYGTLWR